MSLNNVTILIADDNAASADELRRLLETEGAKVLGPAADIEATLAVLETSTPDCVILNAGIAYETAMRVTKRLNAISVPYLIQSDESDALPETLRDARRLSRGDRHKVIDVVKAMIAK
jgi:PleD family two-component response regulator